VAGYGKGFMADCLLDQAAGQAKWKWSDQIIYWSDPSYMLQNGQKQLALKGDKLM
jgi:hypothetical protein